MNLLEDMMTKKADLQIAPLIDVVFLLLIYFMVSAKLVATEKDLSFMLPAPSPPQNELVMPIEVLIEIGEGNEGMVTINGMIYGQGGTGFNDLKEQLMMYQSDANASDSELIVSILPEDAAKHNRIVQVMDACAQAKVKNVSFSST